MVSSNLAGAAVFASLNFALQVRLTAQLCSFPLFLTYPTTLGKHRDARASGGVQTEDGRPPTGGMESFVGEHQRSPKSGTTSELRARRSIHDHDTLKNS